MSKRYPELDLLRGLAILLMVVYHAAYDLAVFWQYDIPVFDGPWKLLARITAGLFLLLVGVSFAISSAKQQSMMQLWDKQWKRFLQIGAGALAVSAVTYGVDPETYVRFGILHLIALSALLLPLFRRSKEGAIFLGLATLFLGQYTYPIDSSLLLLPILLLTGFPPPAFETLDYFPLLPWFGVILIGYGLGHFLYVRRTGWRPYAFDRTPAMMMWPGRHSLAIYLVHQPVILGMLYFLM